MLHIFHSRARSGYAKMFHISMSPKARGILFIAALATTVLVIVLWKLLSPPPARSFNHWRWDEKEWYLILTLRDQSMILDAATTIACYALILLGWVIGGRWVLARVDSLF